MLGTVIVWDESTEQGQIRAYGGSPRPPFSASAINRYDFRSTLAVGQIVVFDYNPSTGQADNVRSFYDQNQVL